MGGSLCDKLGARRVFSLGMAGFLLASALGGLASGGYLSVSRGGPDITDWSDTFSLLSALAFGGMLVALCADKKHADKK